MEPNAPLKPNRAQRRQTLKTVKTVKAAAQDAVKVRRARKLADQIPLQNLSTAGSDVSAADTFPEDPGLESLNNYLEYEKSRKADVPPSDFAVPDRSDPSGKKLRDTDEIVEGLCTIYGVIALPLSQFEPYDGAVLIANGEQSAKSLEKVSRHHKTMRKVLKRLAVGNDYITLVMAHAGIAVAILAHHGIVSPTLNGPFQQTWIPEKDPTWAAQNGLSSPSRSTSGGDSASSMNGSSSTSRPASPSQPHSSVPVPTPAEYEALMRQAQALTPGLHNLPASLASYSPTDTTLRPEQDPAFLPELARRDR